MFYVEGLKFVFEAFPGYFSSLTSTLDLFFFPSSLPDGLDAALCSVLCFDVFDVLVLGLCVFKSLGRCSFSQVTGFGRISMHLHGTVVMTPPFMTQASDINVYLKQHSFHIPCLRVLQKQTLQTFWILNCVRHDT